MVCATKPRAPAYRGFVNNAEFQWLELRLRRAGDCSAPKIWAYDTLSLVAIWLPAVGGLGL